MVSGRDIDDSFGIEPDVTGCWTERRGRVGYRGYAPPDVPLIESPHWSGLAALLRDRRDLRASCRLR
jgi:hypothetical protein